MVTDSEVLMIQSYFQKEQNIGKSIKAQKCDIDKQKTKKIPLNTIRKILRKGGIHYATRNGWQKKIRNNCSINKINFHSYCLLKMFLNNTNFIFIDTVKFWTNDLHSKLWIKTHSDLHKKVLERNAKNFLFDMIVASNLDHGIIAAQAFENHHKGQDWAFFVNKVIELATRLFSTNNVVIFLDNATVQRPPVLDKWIGPRVSCFYNQVNY